jgi:predicted metal-dependent HD superfamily phosphohydrolase
MAAEGDLRKRWDVAVCFLGRDIYYQLLRLQPESSLHLSSLGKVLDDWYSKVEQYYNEPHRAYHNLDHLQDVFSSLDVLLPDDNKAVVQEQHCQSDMLLDETAAQEQHQQQSNTLKNITIVTLATFFHDVIYNPQSSTNEQDSADLFLNFVSDLINGMQRMGNESNIPLAHIDSITKSTVVSQIKQCIIATASHINSAHQARLSPHNGGNTLLSAFLDADMSILGKDTNTYDKYAASIRREYEFVERSVYCEKRAEILTSFLPFTTTLPTMEEKKNMKKQHMYIYATEKGREIWEMQARENLKREISMLRQGLIPLENN